MKYKVSLIVCYQWSTTRGYADQCVFSQTFESIDEAYAAMEEVMPYDYYGDDGYDLENWEAELASGNDDVFMQYNADIDRTHNVLAVLRPVFSE